MYTKTSSMNYCAMITLLLSCLAFNQAAQAVSPAPDGGYAGNNTAEGTQALVSLSSGADNTALGFQALFHNTTANFNSAVGFRALFSDTTGTQNTATGVNALLSNTTAHGNTADGVNALFHNTTGGNNTAIGGQALFSNTTASSNVATGHQALFSNTTGLDNTATGTQALFHNTTGSENNAVGNFALFSNVSGSFNNAHGRLVLHDNTGTQNNAFGDLAMESNTTGNFNTAVGDDALDNCTTGSSNVAIGDEAGNAITTGSGNVCIGAGVNGVAGEDNITRIRNISNTAQASGIFVTVDAVGGTKLGVQSSSARYKEAIKPMDKASETLFALKPVVFRYKADMDPAQVQQYGLIAEDVANVSPDLVVSDPDGRPVTLRFLSIQAMLLNEFLKEHRKVEKQQVSIGALKETIATQNAMIAKQQKQIEALSTGLQKITAQIESSRPALHVAASN